MDDRSFLEVASSWAGERIYISVILSHALTSNLLFKTNYDEPLLKHNSSLLPTRCKVVTLNLPVASEAICDEFWQVLVETAAEEASNQN